MRRSSRSRFTDPSAVPIAIKRSRSTLTRRGPPPRPALPAIRTPTASFTRANTPAPLPLNGPSRSGAAIAMAVPTPPCRPAILPRQPSGPTFPEPAGNATGSSSSSSRRTGSPIPLHLPGAHRVRPENSRIRGSRTWSVPRRPAASATASPASPSSSSAWSMGFGPCGPAGDGNSCGISSPRSRTHASFSRTWNTSSIDGRNRPASAASATRKKWSTRPAPGVAPSWG